MIGGIILLVIGAFALMVLVASLKAAKAVDANREPGGDGSVISGVLAAVAALAASVTFSFGLIHLL